MQGWSVVIFPVGQYLRERICFSWHRKSLVRLAPCFCWLWSSFLDQRCSDCASRGRWIFQHLVSNLPLISRLQHWLWIVQGLTLMWFCLNLTENVVLGPRVLEGIESPNHLHLEQENSSKRRDPKAGNLFPFSLNLLDIPLCQAALAFTSIPSYCPLNCDSFNACLKSLPSFPSLFCEIALWSWEKPQARSRLS